MVRNCSGYVLTIPTPTNERKKTRTTWSVVWENVGSGSKRENSPKRIWTIGYNNFATLKGEVEVAIDNDKVKVDEKWDGLKGYITNISLRSRTLVENYHHLWQIEKAFRICKTDLRTRPLHHDKKRRIKAPICITFVAYTISKELERLLHKHNVLWVQRERQNSRKMCMQSTTHCRNHKKRECKILKNEIRNNWRSTVLFTKTAGVPCPKSGRAVS